MDTTVGEELLYTAAKNSLAADASTENCWSMLTRDSYEHRSSNYKDTKEAIVAMEMRVREEYKMEVMPNAWRSAKSVLLGALKKGILLVDENGVFVGKSAMQKLIKDSKTVVVETPYEVAWKLINKLESLLGAVNPTELAALKTKLKPLCS